METGLSGTPDQPALPLRALILGTGFFCFLFLLWLVPHLPAAAPNVLIDAWKYAPIPALVAALLLTHRYHVRSTIPRFILCAGMWTFALTLPLLTFLTSGAGSRFVVASNPSAIATWLPIVAYFLSGAMLCTYAISLHPRWSNADADQFLHIGSFFLLPPAIILLLWVFLPFPQNLIPLGSIGNGPAIVPFLLDLAAFALLLRKGAWLRETFENGLLWMVLLQLASLSFLLFFDTQTSAAAVSAVLWTGSFLLPSATAEWEMLVLERAAERYRIEKQRIAAQPNRPTIAVPPPEIFSFATQHAQEALYVLNEKGRVAFANEACFRLLGFPPNTLLGRGPDEWSVPPSGGKTVQQLLALARSSRKPLTTTMAQVRKDGTRFAAMLSLEPAAGMFGEPEWFLVRTTNVQQTDEQVLVLRQILDNMPIGICLVDASSLRLLQSNSFAGTLFSRLRIPAPETLHELHRLFRTKDGQPYPEREIPVLETLRTNEEATQDSVIVTPIEGPSMVWKIQSIPLFDTSGTLNTMLVSFDDITGKTAVEHDMTDYISIIAHQLRTPLTAVKWAIVQLRKRDTMSPADVEMLVQTSAEAAEGMFRLVQSILGLAKIESGQMKPQAETVNLNVLLAESLNFLSPQINAKKLSVKQSMLCTIPPLSTDAILLRQVVQNLLENAVKYTPANGEIVSILTMEKGALQWILHDSGIGIPRDALPHIFEKFHRGENAQHADAYGLGLGLYTVRLVLSLLGGRVQCESEEDKGTTFRVLLPLTPQ